VLSRADAERLREAVATQTASKKTTTDEATATSTTTEREIIRKLNIGELALHGLTSNHLLSALAIIGALWAFADDILPDSIYERLGNVLKNTAGQMYRQGWRAALMVIMGGLVIVLLIGLIVSVVGSIVKFFNFTLARQGDNLYRNYGLLTRRASSLPRRRIQVLKIEQGMIRRWFDLATLRADISGSKKEDEDDNAGRDVLMPIVKKAELEELLSVFFPTLSSEPTTWKQVSRLAIRRGTTVGTVILLLIAVVLCANLRSFAGLWLMLLTPLLYWINVKSYRNFGYVLGARFFRTRSGWLGRETHIVPIEKSQVIVVRQSPFDRRLNLATLRIDTAGQAYTGGSPSISNLPVDEALAVARTLAQEASKAGAKF
jgi:putative membrane protein